MHDTELCELSLIAHIDIDSFQYINYNNNPWQL